MFRRLVRGWMPGAKTDNEPGEPVSLNSIPEAPDKSTNPENITGAANTDGADSNLVAAETSQASEAFISDAAKSPGAPKACKENKNAPEAMDENEEAVEEVVSQHLGHRIRHMLAIQSCQILAKHAMGWQSAKTALAQPLPHGHIPGSLINPDGKLDEFCKTEPEDDSWADDEDSQYDEATRNSRQTAWQSWQTLHHLGGAFPGSCNLLTQTLLQMAAMVRGDEEGSSAKWQKNSSDPAWRKWFFPRLILAALPIWHIRTCPDSDLTPLATLLSSFWLQILGANSMQIRSLYGESAVLPPPAHDDDLDLLDRQRMLALSVRCMTQSPLSKRADVQRELALDEVLEQGQAALFAGEEQRLDVAELAQWLPVFLVIAVENAEASKTRPGDWFPGELASLWLKKAPNSSATHQPGILDDESWQAWRDLLLNNPAPPCSEPARFNKDWNDVLDWLAYDKLLPRWNLRAAAGGIQALRQNSQIPSVPVWQRRPIIQAKFPPLANACALMQQRLLANNPMNDAEMMLHLSWQAAWLPRQSSPVSRSQE